MNGTSYPRCNFSSTFFAWGACGAMDINGEGDDSISGRAVTADKPFTPFTYLVAGFFDIIQDGFQLFGIVLRE